MKANVKQVILLGGAYASAFIGVGVASGQEVLQYFTNHGWMAFAAIAVFLIIGSWMCATTMVLPLKDEKADSYTYYLGNKLGALFNKIIIPAIAFLSVGALLCGAGSITKTYFGISSWIGVGIMALALFVTYVAGIDKIINLMGWIGPVLIIFTFLVCLLTIGAGTNVAEGISAVEANKNRLLISDFWWWGAVQYATFQPGLTLIFMVKLGKRANTTKEAVSAAIVGNVLVCAAFVILTIAFMVHYPDIIEASVPTLELAMMVSPILAVVYGVIIYLALYTTIAPSFWILCSSLPTAKNKKSNIIAAAIFAVIFVFGGQLPFSKAINVIWPLIGYTTTVIGVFVLIALIRYIIRKNKISESEVI